VNWVEVANENDTGVVDRRVETERIGCFGRDEGDNGRGLW